MLKNIAVVVNIWWTASCMWKFHNLIFYWSRPVSQQLWHNEDNCDIICTITVFKVWSNPTVKRIKMNGFFLLEMQWPVKNNSNRFWKIKLWVIKSNFNNFQLILLLNDILFFKFQFCSWHNILFFRCHLNKHVSLFVVIIYICWLLPSTRS